jgi:hypothetical protein
MPQRSLQSIGERCERDAYDLTVEHVWVDLGYTDHREAAVGIDNLILHIETSVGRFTGVFAKIRKIEDAVLVVLLRMGLSGYHDLVFNEVVLEPVDRTLVSFGLINDDNLDLVAAP